MSGAFALLNPRPRDKVDGWWSVTTMAAIAGALAVLTIVSGWRGGDFPAQVFRAELVRREGFVVWNNSWFGGHNTLSYSVLSPVLGAVFGPLTIGAISGVVAAVMFERILRFTFGSAALIGATWFALGTVTNLIVGRVTYALGFALGLAAVYAFQRRHMVFAVALAVLCSLSSPLAGCFLVVVAAAVVCASRERRAAAVALLTGAFVPLAAAALLFPNSGAQPYEPWALIWDLSLCAIVAALYWSYPVMRWGAAGFGTLCLLSYVVPTAMGGNVSRFGMYVAGPLIACALYQRRRVALLVALAIPLLIWQWYPAVDGIALAGTDPSTKAAYYDPAIDYLTAQPGPIGRVEIPSTYRHWEAAYAAPTLLLARGWERQLDIEYNSILYSKTPLNSRTYLRWLNRNGVKFVALPDAQLDDSSDRERDLLLGGLPYLDEVWHDQNWRIWKVRDFRGLVDGPAELLAVETDRLVLDVHEPDPILVRVRGGSHWRVPGNGCTITTTDGWTVLQNLPVGRVEISQSFGGSPCPSS